MPFAVKNLFDVQGLPTRAGSRIGRESAPAARDAVLVRRLEAAGAVLVGALNMDEYAYGFTTENTHDGPTHNPHALQRLAGGSSGGSAAAVAAGQVSLALGSDTNGSIRVPAALCGVYGLRPTFGRLPRTGSYPFAASLDALGPFARSVRDLALAYDAMQGPDLEDPACAQRGAAPVTPALDAGVEGLRIGVLGGWFEEQALAPAREAVRRVAAVLQARQVLQWPEVDRARAAAFVVTSAEGGALHLGDLRTRAHDFDPMTRDRFMAGALLPAAWVVQAHRHGVAGDRRAAPAGACEHGAADATRVVHRAAGGHGAGVGLRPGRARAPPGRAADRRALARGPVPAGGAGRGNRGCGPCTGGPAGTVGPGIPPPKER